MASLQAYTSRGRRYYRIVESYRHEGKPRIRVLAHLGKAEDLLALVRQSGGRRRVRSFSAGGVTALYHLAEELGLASTINRVLEQSGRSIRRRDGLTVGETLVAGIIGRACEPSSKRAFGDWAAQTWLPELMGFAPEKLSSQHFWDQMEVVPTELLSRMEEAVLVEVVRIERLRLEAILYDTTNFYTYLATENQGSQLAQRGHNKQKRHDLRQFGMALAMDRQSQLPLFHTLYEGQRNDSEVLSTLIRPVRRRLRRLQAKAAQLTLVFDSGGSSSQNLQKLEQEKGGYYVTSVRPSDHRQWLQQVADRLRPVTLSTGETIRAYRVRRRMKGKEREVVVIFSAKLYRGQLRGLHQHLERAGQELEKLGTESRYAPETVQARLDKIRGRQYVRHLLQFAVKADAQGGSRIRVWCDVEEYRRLQNRYFGLRILISNRRRWSTAEIIEAYRAQSREERGFRDLKDPGMIATRPQFHWTDQKLRVHAFMCVMAYLLVRLLCWRLRRQQIPAQQPRSILAQLKKIRVSRIVQLTGKAGRPRLSYELEEMETELTPLAQACRALPPLPP